MWLHYKWMRSPSSSSLDASDGLHYLAAKCRLLGRLGSWSGDAHRHRHRRTTKWQRHCVSTKGTINSCERTYTENVFFFSNYASHGETAKQRDPLHMHSSRLLLTRQLFLEIKINRTFGNGTHEIESDIGGWAEGKCILSAADANDNWADIRVNWFRYRIALTPNETKAERSEIERARPLVEEAWEAKTLLRRAKQTERWTGIRSNNLECFESKQK